jgi:uncharacterized protein YggE
MDADVIVRGEATRHAVADRAVITVSINAESADRETAFRRAGELVAAVDAALEAAGDAIARAVTAALVVQPRTRWHDGEQQRTGWQAARVTTVEVVQLDELGSVLTTLVLAGAEIHGPRWEIDAAHPVHDEVRQAAAEDARRRAEAYSSALGVELGPLAWIAEPGLRLAPGGGQPGAPIGITRMALAAGPAAEPEMEVAPAELAITAAVEVGYSVVRG